MHDISMLSFDFHVLMFNKYYLMHCICANYSFFPFRFLPVSCSNEFHGGAMKVNPIQCEHRILLGCIGLFTAEFTYAGLQLFNPFAHNFSSVSFPFFLLTFMSPVNNYIAWMLKMIAYYQKTGKTGMLNFQNHA